ncbi:hypothetical protein LTR86_007783 [Recurvomyces mirabilis]|nr:hypothetical protein LTR86_007783 [Recurvomyces mirabilis]
MPPKKKTTVPSASQPEPVKPTRASGRKRRLSDASNVTDITEDRPSSSQGAVTQAAAKKRKRGRPAATSAEPEVIVEEAEQEITLSTHHDDAMQFGGDATMERERPGSSRTFEHSIEVQNPRSKHVKFGGVAENGEDVTSSKKLTTPHPRKTSTITRRTTQSPSLGATSQRRSTSLSRKSLPPGWNEEATTQESSQVKYTMVPLAEALQTRLRQRSQLSQVQSARGARTALELDQLKQEASEKEERIKEIELDLVEQRRYASQVDDDEPQQRVMALEAELSDAKREHTHHLDTHGLQLDDGMLVLSSREAVTYPDLFARSTTSHANDVDMNGVQTETKITKTTRTSLSAQLTEDWDTERANFENAILALSKEANDAKARLQILEIELGALSQQEGVDIITIVKSIRQSHADIRDAVEAVFPDSLPDHATNQDIIEIMIANLHEQVDILRIKETEVTERDMLIADLSNQINGLLDHLAEKDIRLKTLDERWMQLDRDNEENGRTIEELEEELNESLAERDDLRKQNDELKEEVKALGQDHAESVRNHEALQLSLEGYRREELRLTELVERMEQDHRDTVAKMAKEREETVNDLEDRLDEATRLRTDVEVVIVERQTELAALEHQVADMSTEREALIHELQTVKAERDIEIDARDVAETSLEQKNAEVEDLEARVGRLEEELEILTSQLDELRKVNETERTQREAAEQDLDDRNAEVDELTKKLASQGAEANELRMKMFVLQQEHTEKVKVLEETLADREEQYQTDIADEVARREAADDLAQQRAATILALELRIEEIELQMRTDLAERDERIVLLESDLAVRDNEIEDLKMDLTSAENSHDIEKTRLEDRLEELEGSVVALQETINLHEATIVQLQQDSITTIDLHNSEIEDRNAEIADLHASLEQVKNERADLETQAAGLERRVEQEAEAMLDLQNAKEDEIDDYKVQLKDKQALILVVEQKAKDADEAWQEILRAREEEIEILKSEAVAGEEVTEELTTDFEAFRLRFREVVARQNATIGKLQDAIDAAKIVADEDGEALKREAGLALEEVEGFDFVGKLKVTRRSVVRQTQASSSSQVVPGGGSSQVSPQKKSGKGGKKGRKVVESGVLLEEAGIIG